MNKSRDDFEQNLYSSKTTPAQTKISGAADVQDELRALQLLELNVLRVIADICKKHDLRYFLAEGSLLGAIRHQGFIPWDDDVDVCMPREDYEKFIEIAAKEMPNGYISGLQNDTGIWGTFRVSDTNHGVCRSLDGQELHLFVSVDIFPIDGFPNRKFEQRVHWMNIIFSYGLFRAAQADQVDKNKKRGFLLRSAIKLATLIPIGKLVNEEKALQHLTDTLKKCSFSDSDVVMSFYSEYSKKDMNIPSTAMPKSYFGDGRGALFEGEQFSIPSEAEKVLSREYGDYLALPPLEERKAKHSMRLITEENAAR